MTQKVKSGKRLHTIYQCAQLPKWSASYTFKTNVACHRPNVGNCGFCCCHSAPNTTANIISCDWNVFSTSWTTSDPQTKIGQIRTFQGLGHKNKDKDLRSPQRQGLTSLSWTDKLQSRSLQTVVVTLNYFAVDNILHVVLSSVARFTVHQQKKTRKGCLYFCGKNGKNWSHSGVKFVILFTESAPSGPAGGNYLQIHRWKTKKETIKQGMRWEILEKQKKGMKFGR